MVFQLESWVLSQVSGCGRAMPQNARQAVNFNAGYVVDDD